MGRVVFMLNVNDESFEKEVMMADKPVVLEFYSESCIPCKRIAPILAELEEEYTEAKFVNVNIKFGRETAKKYNIAASPTVIFIKNGSEISRIRGLVPKAEIAAKIKELSK